MSDELEQRLAHVQSELAKVRREIDALQAERVSPVRQHQELQAQLEKKKRELGARGDEVDQLETEVKQLREEAAQVSAAAITPY